MVIALLMAVQFVVSYTRETERIKEHMEREMREGQQACTAHLYDIIDATYEMASFTLAMLNEPDSIYALADKVLESFPDVASCYIGFEPGYYANRSRLYGPCAYREGTSILHMQMGDEMDYTRREWYTGAMDNDTSSFWTPAYTDPNWHRPVFTNSLKIVLPSGETVGVVGVDFFAEWLQKALEDSQPYDEAACRLYNSHGALLMNIGQTKEEDERGDFITKARLSPFEMSMVMVVPKEIMWQRIGWISLLTFCVLLFSITLLGWLVWRYMREEKALARVELDREVMRKEMLIAHTIQMNILRHDFPKDETIDLQAALLPMREVGGDLYDYHRDGDTLWFIIGDVSGKGVSAAMIMSATVNLFRAVGRHAHTPKHVMEEINEVLSENNPSLTFVTALIGRLHIPSGQLLYCNAGHCAPLVVGSEKCEAGGERSEDASLQVRRLELEPNIPLGYDGSYGFVEQGYLLGQGETLVLYTDGVTEARNAERKMLGMKRLEDIAQQVIGKSVEDAALQDRGVEGLLAEVKAYIGSAEPTDDITIMTIRKQSAVEPAELRVPNHEDQWPVLRQVIHEYGTCLGIDKRTLKKLEVAAEEAVVNILHHSGATEITLALTYDAEAKALHISLTDDGVPFDPTAHVANADAVAERQVGGLGISLIRQIVDQMRYRRVDDTNQLTLIKLIVDSSYLG